MKKNFTLILVLIAMLYAVTAEAASRYIVTWHLAPVFEGIKGAKKAPQGGWKAIDEESLPMDSYSAMLVYGDVVEGTVEGDWLLMKDENMEGFVELAGLSPMPKYESFKARAFQVLKDGTVPYLLPNEKPVSEFSKFSLPRGIVVKAEGRAESSDGKKWLLCSFSTEYSREGLDEKFREYEEVSFAGSDNRHAWLPESELCDLANSKPDLTRVEKENLSIQNEFLIKNGFYIDPKPVILGKITEDDIMDLYNNVDENTAKFITADFPMHVFHLYFDHVLREIEEKFLIKRTVDFVNAVRIAVSELPEPKSELERTAVNNLKNLLQAATTASAITLVIEFSQNHLLSF